MGQGKGSRFSFIPQKVAHWVVAKRWYTFTACVALVAVGWVGQSRLGVEADYKIWFPKDSQDLAAYEKMQTDYSKADNIFFVLVPKDGTVFTKDTLSAIHWLTKESWKLPFTTRVDSIANFQHSVAKRDELEVGDLVKNPETLTAADIANIKQVSMNEPFLVKSLVSDKGHVAAVNVIQTLQHASPYELLDLAAGARKLQKELETNHPNIKVHLTGFNILEALFAELPVQDMNTLTPAMYIILLVALALMLRSIMGVIATFTVLTGAHWIAMGFAAFTGLKINTVSAVVPTIVMTLAVTDSVHVLIGFLRNLEKGHARLAAIRESIAHSFFPLSLTTFTTVVGFLSLNFNESPPFQDYGNMVAIGLTGAWVLSIFGLPALLSVLPFRVKKRNPDQMALIQENSMRFENRLAGFVLSHHRRLFWGTAVLSVVCVGLASRNQLNEEWVKYIAKRIEFRQSTDFVSENLTGIYDLLYSLDSGEAGGIHNPEFLTQLDSFSNWMRQQPEVTSVVSLADVMKRLNKNMHGDNNEFYRMPDKQKLAAQYLLLYEMSLPYGTDLTTFVNMDKSATRLMAKLVNIRTMDQIALDLRAREWMRVHTPLLVKRETPGTSYTMMFAKINERLIPNMVYGALFSLVIISILMMVALRSVKYGLISLIPNLIPAAISLGIWGVFVGQIGIATAIVLDVTLGIVVDDTVHFLGSYLKARRDLGFDAHRSVAYAFAHAGRETITTAVILMAGFSVLALSPFELNGDMGLLTALTVGLGLFAELFFLAPLLLFIDGGKMKVNSQSLENIVPEVLKSADEIEQRQLEAASPLRSFLLPVAALLLGAASTTALAGFDSEFKATKDAAKQGRLIAEESWRQESGYGNFKSNLKMIIKNSAGTSTSRLMRLKVLETAGQGPKTLAIIDNPSDVKGTALLSYTYKSKTDDQWLFLPEVNRVKRIASTNRSGPFLGSEFAYEDFRYDVPERFTYKFIEKKACSIGQCYLVERTPRDSDSGYSKQIAWFDTEHFRVVKVEYYDRKHSHLKTAEFSNFKKYGSHYWRPSKVVMTNHENKNVSELHWSAIQLAVGIKAQDMDSVSLSRVR